MEILPKLTALTFKANFAEIIPPGIIWITVEKEEKRKKAKEWKEENAKRPFFCFLFSCVSFSFRFFSNVLTFCFFFNPFLSHSRYFPGILFWPFCTSDPRFRSPWISTISVLNSNSRRLFSPCNFPPLDSLNLWAFLFFFFPFSLSLSLPSFLSTVRE